MPQKILRLVLKVGVILSLLSFLIISDGLYFPYISGKQLYFYILIEALLPIWIYLLIRHPQYRPSFSWITYGLVFWLTVMLVSAIFGVDFNLSFWGDTERMQGWFALAHYFVFYLVVITVFRSKKDWQYLLNAVVAVAVVVAFYAWITADGAKFQGNVNLTSNISTLGNASYVAGLMLFAVYFLLYLWQQGGHKLLKIWYVLASVAVLWAFFYANVSASQAALVISAVVFLSALGFLSQSRKVKKWSWSAAGLMVFLMVAVFIGRQSALFDNNYVGKALRDFSGNNTSLNARLFAWRAGWEGFLERPLLGYGYGNFAYPFDKFFKAGLYQWTPNEEYYDRAHNMPMEMLATAGIFGFLAYLGLFAAVAVEWRRCRIGLNQPVAAAALAALFVAYFIHNLAVFDSLANFIALMTALALVSWLARSKEPESDAVSVAAIDQRRLMLILILSIILSAGLIYLNVRTGRMLFATVQTAKLWQAGNLSAFFEGYDKTFSYRTPLDRDSRVMLTGLVLSAPTKLSQAPDYKIRQLFESLLRHSDQNLGHNNYDYLFLVRHTALLELFGLATNNQDLLERALVTTDLAIAHGGQHVAAFLYKANILLSLQRPIEAAAVWRQILDFYPQYEKLFCHLAGLELRYGIEIDEAEMWRNFDNCLDRGRINDLGRDGFLLEAVKHYENNNDKVRLDKLRRQLIP